MHTCNPILETGAGGLARGEGGYQANWGSISRLNKKKIYIYIFFILFIISYTNMYDLC